MATFFVSSYYLIKYIYSTTQQYVLLNNNGLKPTLIFLALGYLLCLLAWVDPNMDNKSMKTPIFLGSFFYVTVLVLNYFTLFQNQELLYTPNITFINIINIFLLLLASCCFTRLVDLIIQYLIKIDFTGHAKEFLSNEKVLTAVVVAIITACFGLLGK